MVVRKADNPVNNARPIHARPGSGGPVLRQITFDWKVADKYRELCNFEIEVKNIFIINNYKTHESKSVPIILNWIGQEGVRFMQTLNDKEQGNCRTSAGLFELLSDKFKSKYNETILSLQYCKLLREQNEDAKGWIGYLRIKANEYGYN